MIDWVVSIVMIVTSEPKSYGHTLYGSNEVGLISYDNRTTCSHARLHLRLKSNEDELVPLYIEFQVEKLFLAPIQDAKRICI